ncbi:transglycosylase SLT domain-containing protein [Undibacterium cyanobacteriorum]|uniref:Transglycosylase SLT domain-containing protein n=1 Tax=Undibacterium cyanobacteriorum TaxID=3073561 RepID=A0ABY9REB2_9BURK|nr:transglycosylase SLT domain-containing protein [Undibacterium sp. 20NA77.5]WMW79565.1 transglycosylase SLT domain-containing protein [Undibacterium sp. 20NA77.5]
MRLRLSVVAISSVFALLSQGTAFAREDGDDLLKLSKNLSVTEAPKASLEARPNELKIDDSERHAQEPSLNIVEADLWSRIRNGYAIPNLENRLVNHQTEWYGARVDYLKRIIQRGSRYLYHVVEALDKRGMPTDLALLPFIESAFNPNAISSAKASGMWQFMPATGRDFNLKQSLFKDDRRGVLDSTEAALDYLQRLYNMFGDWQLALAAYNWGEGSVQRAIKRQQAKGLPIDFDSLSAQMPAETKNYVPKLQAVKNIIGNPEQFGLNLPPLENSPYFTSVKKEKDIDVELAARLADIPISEFKALNPQFNRPIITGGNNTSILLPIDKVATFEDNFSNWKGPLSSWTTLNIQKSERIETLASRYGYQADIVREVNAIPAKTVIKAGSTILVPKSDKAADEDIPAHIAEQAQLNIEKAGVSTRKIAIKVGRKDNLNTLAKRYKVSVADIKSWNKLRSEKLVAGQKLELQIATKEKPRSLSEKQLASKKNHSTKAHSRSIQKAANTPGRRHARKA